MFCFSFVTLNGHKLACCIACCAEIFVFIVYIIIIICNIGVKAASSAQGHANHSISKAGEYEKKAFNIYVVYKI